eukprot:TRINITY_DN9023_c0_g1_i3.p1 TRINITY_DN9023_c0_g1~~TRINITY_DN9023_c0_g1_i3.p1  ORF type:complete len:900 (+),score=263.76 TRINITY_DN9023_c0_g1_i3:174-2873(+)
MGSGASKAPETNDQRSAKQKKEDEEVFQEVCRQVFQKCDADQDGVLTYQEFRTMLDSKTLDLKLSETEIEILTSAADSDDDGYITYEEFLPVLRDLLQRVYRTKWEDWNDWTRVGKDANGKDVYLNKRTGKVTHDRPDNFKQDRVEERTFEYIKLAEGHEVTTYVSEEDGQRYYMDWDTSKWRLFPDSWAYALHPDPEAKEVIQQAQERDPRLFELRHPKHGSMYSYLLEHPRNFYLYLDETTQEWVRMPLEWEKMMPEVQQKLRMLSEVYPQWQNWREQMLCLHETNYDIDEAVAYADINWNLSGDGDLDQQTPGSLVRARTTLGQYDVKPAVGKGGTELSGQAVVLIDGLKQKVADRDARIRRLEKQLERKDAGRLQLISRERTITQLNEERSSKARAEAEAEIRDLCKQVQQLADNNAFLEEQVHQLSGGSISKSAKDRGAKMEQLQIENAALKQQVASLQEQLATPFASTAGKQIISRLHLKIKHLQEEYRDLRAGLTSEIEILMRLFRKAVEQSAALSADKDAAVKEITERYMKESLLRKELYNKLQELRGNIRVFCRVRKDTRGDCMLTFPSDTELKVRKLHGGEASHEYDKCYGPDTKQEQVFSDTKPIIMSCVDGYNVCLMAYGQTGSGKTYTMMGPKENPGVNRRAIRELFTVCQERQDIDYTISVAIMEVYNEKIFDLATTNRSKTLNIHRGPQGMFVGDLTETVVTSVDDIVAVMAMGDKNRSTSATKMNTDSSRSHFLLQIKVQGVNRITHATTWGKLTLVDLAGSERVSKTEASGARLVEAAAINKSLSTLGQVFKALAVGSPHVPYRNSKLTHLLQDSLGGDAKVAVFVNVSPLESNLSETHMSLQFGQNIRKVELGAASKQTGPPSKLKPLSGRPKKKRASKRS